MSIRLGPPSPARDVTRRGAEDSITVLVRNDTGAAVPQFGVLALGDPLVLPEDSEPTFRQRRAFAGDTPSASSALAILQEPLGAGAIGRAVVQGVTPAKLSGYTSQSYAGPDADDLSHLAAQENGTARIIWAADSEDTDGNRWAVVMLGWTPAVRDLRYYRQPDNWYPCEPQGFYIAAGDPSTWPPEDDGFIYLHAFILPRAATLTGISYIPTGGTFRVGLYRAESVNNLYAQDLVIDCGTNTDGHVVVSDLFLPAGLYWVALGAGYGLSSKVAIVLPTRTTAGDDFYVEQGVLGSSTYSNVQHMDAYWIDYPNWATLGALPNPAVTSLTRLAENRAGTHPAYMSLQFSEFF